MKTLYAGIFCLFLPLVATSQTSIPLFEDDIPNLGREAKPLKELHLTPDELPDVRVSLGDSGKSAKPAKPTPKTSQKLILPKEPNPPRRLSSEKAAEMDEKLSAEIRRYQEERAKAAQSKTPPPPAPKKVSEPQMPASLVALFGKMHDVRGFEISGIMLGMTPDEVTEAAQEQGYTVTRVEHGIPLHRTSFYEHNCRAIPVRRTRDLQECIIDQARNDEVYYISSLTLSKPETAEYMQVLFSTYATDNQAYKIYYENEGDNSLNFTRKNLAKKIRRRDAFWKMVFDTYGYPDDKESLIWGDPDRAYMKARMQGANYNAYLILEDKEIPDGDYRDADEQKG
ncbi:MAG: hypothetical protein SPL08_02045, partial [Pseudomonadota bacterium]|nr:hypothetical protein [Pseudomonadota bacterium]